VFNDPDLGMPGGENGWRSFYFPDTARLTRHEPPQGLARWHDWPACRLEYTEGIDMPYDESPWKDELRLHGRRPPRPADATPARPKPGRVSSAKYPAWAWEQDYADLRDAIDGPPHHLMGYSSPCVVCADPIPGPGWRHLLTVYSDRNLDWCWSDGHFLYWYVSDADLRAGRFDNTQIVDG
jgi:hypothetical protein